MRDAKKWVMFLLALGPLAAILHPQQTAVYEGARVITGDGSAPIENGMLVVRNSRIVELGSSIKAPAGAARVNLAGKTIIPALINVHTHIGYEGYTSWGAQNYTAKNVLDHLQREAFYGTAVALSVGSSPFEISRQIQHDQEGGKLPLAARFLFIPGYAPPNGGPDAILKVATDKLHAINEVSTGPEARDSIRKMAGRGVRAVKIWVDDRRGTYPKMTPEVYNAIIEEAHRHGMMVHAHATTLADQKAVVRAGVDVLVHLIQAEKVDDELMTVLKEKRPYWATVIGLSDPTVVCEPDPFFEQSLPDDVILKIRANHERRPLTANCGPLAPTEPVREETVRYNFPRMVASGARVVLGTDTGVHPGHTFGSGEHLELARWVQLGLTPMQAITAATQRPAELLGLKDEGALAVGKRANFIVLDANPLDDIHNTRRIVDVYLGGVKVDREKMRAQWKR